jgi:hypothetical protein
MGKERHQEFIFNEKPVCVGWISTLLANGSEIVQIEFFVSIRVDSWSILLGLGMSVPQIYGLTKPKQFAAAARKFPRNLPVGIVLMLLATAWFVWNVNVEPIADFSVFKPYMMAGFTAVGILTCIFVQDFLAVRGLAVVLLLLAKLMVDTGRPHLGESPFVLVIQIWAYLLVVLGIWFTVTPWKLRDILNWATATEDRIRLGSRIRLVFAVFVLILGLTAFRGM